MKQRFLITLLSDTCHPTCISLFKNGFVLKKYRLRKRMSNSFKIQSLFDLVYKMYLYYK